MEPNILIISKNRYDKLNPRVRKEIVLFMDMVVIKNESEYNILKNRYSNILGIL
jgi:TRAP-type C4-dicarboxylate transport system substrate-binding protein